MDLFANIIPESFKISIMLLKFGKLTIRANPRKAALIKRILFQPKTGTTKATTEENMISAA